MGIVRFALKFPHTFYVVALLISFLGLTAVVSMPTDIFPEIRIPVVTVIWTYTGLSTPEMEQRVTTYGEFSISASVNGIKNIESQTLNGISVQKIFFQPDVNIDLAIAQIVSGTNAVRGIMPPGIQAPIVLQYNASSVPVLQIGLSSDELNEQQLYDYGIYRLRQRLAPINGITLPTPAGGRYRQIMVDLDPAKLQAKGLTPLDIVNAVNTQNLTLPSGTAKIGDTQYAVRTNATPVSLADLNNIPVKFANGATVFLKDVGLCARRQAGAAERGAHRGAALGAAQHHQERQRIDACGRQCRQGRPQPARAAAPPGMKITELFDQSVFVRELDRGVLREGAIAAVLTALMIVLFLGSWRSTLIVAISIPLSILASLTVLYFLGETINTMTLGGLALAVGILVDDFDRDHRKHASPAHRGAASRCLGDPAWRGRDRGADSGVDAGDLLRVHLGAVPPRAGQISVHAARPCGGVCDARLLWAVADPDPDHDRLAAQGRTPWRFARPQGVVRPAARPVRTWLRGNAARLYGDLPDC